MAKHRAIIVGAGRIGCGYQWIETPYIYCHGDAYKALSDRVELVGVIDSDKDRATAASKKYHIPNFRSIRDGISELNPNIISICTPPESRRAVYDQVLSASTDTKAFHEGYGWWVEKPFNDPDFTCTWPIQVNFMRRADAAHVGLKNVKKGHLEVWAKKDIHTIPHFTDLARFWGLGKDQLTYHQIAGPNHYEWTYKTATPLNPNTKIRFEGGGLSDGFMERMLGNLLDAVEKKSELISSVESAKESEKWANEILEQK